MSRITPRAESLSQLSAEIADLAQYEHKISVENVRILIKKSTDFFRQHVISAGYSVEQVKPLTTKFRDAGRRSAPWRPASGRVPGRPQDGADGNRRLRWLFDPDHKFYADEVNATLVEVKYIFQTLSMEQAPPLDSVPLQSSFEWLLKHKIVPGSYVDPIQLIAIPFDAFIADPRLVQSGHLIPLDRGGKHIPDNAFLMLARSNQIQGNQTLEELIDLMERIVVIHRSGNKPVELKVDPTNEN
jgi:hypothetical protein